MSETEEKLVSVITPLYNAKAYIEKTIASVQAQTYGNWEMIVIDDGSTDGSAELVKKCMEKDERIHLVSQKNSGVAAARNHGMKVAKGRYLAFLDSDDLWKPEKLSRQLAFMEEKDCGFCYSGCDVIDETGKPTGQVRKVPEYLTYQKYLWGNVVPCLTVLVDRTRTGDFEMPAMGHEDYATWLTVVRKLGEAYGINEPLASYRINRGSVSSNKLRAMRWTWHIYRDSQKLPVYKSALYLMGHAIQAVRKR